MHCLAREGTKGQSWSTSPPADRPRHSWLCGVCLSQGSPPPTSSLQKLFLAISSGNVPSLSTYITAFSPRRAVKEDLHQYNPLLIPFPLLLSYLHYLQLRRGC